MVCDISHLAVIQPCGRSLCTVQQVIWPKNALGKLLGPLFFPIISPPGSSQCSWGKDGGDIDSLKSLFSSPAFLLPPSPPQEYFFFLCSYLNCSCCRPVFFSCRWKTFSMEKLLTNLGVGVHGLPQRALWRVGSLHKIMDDKATTNLKFLLLEILEASITWVNACLSFYLLHCSHRWYYCSIF